jgi:hypothetical protein
MTDDSCQKSATQTVAKKAVTIVLEVLLVAVIIGLIVATWLPAMIGANPDVGAPIPHHHR